MKTIFNIIKVIVITILLGVGLLAVLGDLIDKETTLGWYLSFVFIKLIGILMIVGAIYLVAHFKDNNYIDDDMDRILDNDKEWGNEEME